MKRIPTIPSSVQHFLLSLLFLLFLPIVPLILEGWLTGTVEEKSITLLAAVFPLSIGVSSRSRLFFGCSVVVSLVFSAAYGLLAGSSTAPPGCTELSVAAIICVAIVHAAERWNLHIVDATPFLDF